MRSLKIKFRGEDVEVLNSLVGSKNYDLLLGYDSEGNEVYEGDVIEDEDGEEYQIVRSFRRIAIDPEENLRNYTVKE